MFFTKFISIIKAGIRREIRTWSLQLLTELTRSTYPPNYWPPVSNTNSSTFHKYM